MKMDTFYNLVVKDVSSLENGLEIVEDRKDAIQFSLRFHSSSNCYYSYLLRTVAEFLIASGLVACLCVLELSDMFEVNIAKLFRKKEH